MNFTTKNHFGSKNYYLYNLLKLFTATHLTTIQRKKQLYFTGIILLSTTSYAMKYMTKARSVIVDLSRLPCCSCFLQQNQMSLAPSVWMFALHISLNGVNQSHHNFTL